MNTASPQPTVLPPGKTPPWRAVTLVVVMLALALAAVLLERRGGVQAVLEWAHRQGPWAAPALVGMFIVGSVLMFPGSLMGTACGFILGWPLGVVAGSLGAMLGATAAMGLGRTIARPWMTKKMQGHPQWQALDDAVNAHSFRVVVLMRLTPVFPFNISNYAFGLTRVRIGSYMLATLLGKLPGVTLTSYIGSTMASLSRVLAGEAWEQKTTGLLLALPLTLVCTGLLYRFARKALRQTIGPP